MATKSNLITTINNFITAIITQIKVRNAFLEIINTLFQTTIVQTNLSGTDVFYYNLKYKKQGNLVYLDGYIQNKYSIAKSTTNILNIPNAELYAKTSQDTIYFGFTDSTGTPVMISLSNDVVYLLGNLAPNQKIWINLTYQTND